MKTEKRSVTHLQSLLSNQAKLSADAEKKTHAAHEMFPTLAPQSFVKKIQPNAINDPLLLQILPQPAELQSTNGYINDPVGDNEASKAQGLIQKYDGRILLITTGACAIHCRYCFRRHFPYNDSHIGGDKLVKALDYIRSDTSISEIILSGGDPLTLKTESLDRITSCLNAIPHIKRLRIHSRVPVVAPERIDKPLFDWLTNLKLPTALVIHANHPNEIDNEVQTLLQRISSKGISLLNQSVLLKGVNDDATTLKTLSERLFECKVLPYYLHLLDPVAGAHHFEVSETEAKQLITHLRHTLPGYLIPRLAREIAGEPSKTVLM